MKHFACLAALIVLPVAAFAAPAQPAYLDDRSTPEAVIASYYNAISRAEYARAYSYFGEGAAPANFDKWQAGYADTAVVSVTFGTIGSEGAAGSIYYTVPVLLTVEQDNGQHAQFTGCYTLRLAQPANQAQPPFQPMHIEGARLEQAAKGAAPPSDCEQ